MKSSEQLPVPESNEKHHGSIPKIIRLVPQSTDKDVLQFQKEIYDLKRLFDRVDLAGVVIGEKKLSLQVVMEIGALLRCLCRPAVRDSIRPVPPVQQHARK